MLTGLHPWLMVETILFLWLARYQVEPHFRNVGGDPDAHHADRIAFEMKVGLKSTQSWIAAPSHLLLVHNGRQFNVRVDPTMLPPGAHYGEVQGFDLNNVDQYDPRAVEAVNQNGNR